MTQSGVGEGDRSDVCKMWQISNRRVDFFEPLYLHDYWELYDHNLFQEQSRLCTYTISKGDVSERVSSRT